MRIQERERVNCDRCEMTMINGLACHETGCPNMGAKWEDGEWVKYRDCFECGFPVRVGESCDCQEPMDDDDDSGDPLSVDNHDAERDSRAWNRMVKR